MSDCECLSGCIFFNDKMAGMPSMANIMKKKYCQGEPAGCARYQVFKAKGKGNVPGDLFPNQLDRVKKLIG